MIPRLLLVLLSLGLLSSPTTARAGDQEPPDKKLSATWTVTEGDKPAWSEKLKLVVKPDGRSFASATLTPPKPEDKKAQRKQKADGPFPQVNVLWREGDGRLTKYFREEDKRKGQGLRAFRRQELIRIVGVNTERKDAAEIPGTSHAVWDPVMWSTLWDWLRHVPKSGDRAEVGFLDVAKRKAGKATLVRAGKRVLTNKGGEGAEVSVWSVEGLGVAGLELALDGKGRMVGARSAKRGLLLVGWSWEAPKRGGAGEADASEETRDDAATPPTDADDDGGVGP